jgi:uncharacterized protein YoxC
MVSKNPTFIKMSVKNLRGKANLSAADLKILIQAVSDLADCVSDLTTEVDSLKKRIGEK